MSHGLHIVHLASGREWRGGQRQVWLLARALAQHPAIASQRVITGQDTELAKRLSAAQVEVLGARWRAGFDPRVLPVTLPALHPHTILHAHDGHAVALGSVATRLRKVPFVATRRVAFRLRRPGGWAAADRLIAVSNAVRDRLEHDGIEPSRITVIPSAIDATVIQAAPPAGIRASLDIPPSGTLVVQVGALTAEKGHDLLLEAASLFTRGLPDLHLVLVGSGPLRQELEADVLRRGLANRVHFLGEIEEPAGVLREADVAVLPSREEGFGSTILEALALGVPVIATRVGGIPEALSAGGGLLVPPGDAIALSDAIASLVRDRDRRNILSAEGREAAGAFTVSRMVEAVVTVYRSVSHSVGGT